MQRWLNRLAANQRQLGRRRRSGGWILSGQTHQPAPLSCRVITTRFFDLYQLGNKEAIEKERARLTDEMNRGYFADIKELKQHGGKIAIANKTLIPETTATKFPDFEANYSDGRAVKLPIRSSGNADLADAKDCPRVSLLCVSFRASSQTMIKSWSEPFLDEFNNAKHIQLYEVSFIDAWYLRLSPIKRVLLWTMKKPKKEENFALERHMIYSFGDHYYFRKELKILNLLTGYIYLLDKFGRIRWQGTGLASQEELPLRLSREAILAWEVSGEMETVSRVAYETLVTWKPPDEGWFKLNTDGAAKGNPGIAGGGGVVRDCYGNWSVGFVNNTGVCNSLASELWAMWRGLSLAWSRRYRKVVVETDSEVVASCLAEGLSKEHPLFSLVNNCRGLISQEWQVEVKWCYREGNQVADWLSNFALSFPLGFHVLDVPPDECAQLLSRDRLGLGTPRRVRM